MSNFASASCARGTANGLALLLIGGEFDDQVRGSFDIQFWNDRAQQQWHRS